MLCCGVGEVCALATIRDATLGLQFSPRINKKKKKEDF